MGASAAMEPCPFNCGSSLEPIVSATFAGSAEELQTANDVWLHQVRCTCGAEGPVKESGTDAIAAWNVRNPKPDAELGCEELAVIKGRQVTVTFKDSGKAFDLFNELQDRASLEPAAPVEDGEVAGLIAAKLKPQLGALYAAMAAGNGDRAADQVAEKIAEAIKFQPPATDALVEALEFYADPENYHAIGFGFDRPCGLFEDDFGEEHGHEDYDRPMPGKRARAALAKRQGGGE